MNLERKPNQKMNQRTINYINYKKCQRAYKVVITTLIVVLPLAALSILFSYIAVKGLDKSLDNWECRTGQTCEWVDGGLVK